MQQWIIRKGGSDGRMQVETISICVSLGYAFSFATAKRKASAAFPSLGRDPRLDKSSPGLEEVAMFLALLTLIHLYLVFFIFI